MKLKFKAKALMTGTVFLLVYGCGGGGGGGGSGDQASTQEPPPSGEDQPSIASVQVGNPVCSADGPGEVDGRLFFGNTGYVDVIPACTNPSTVGEPYMEVWLQVNVTRATVDHYDWEIIGWQNEFPHGSLALFDEVVEIDLQNGRYVVRTESNRIRFDTTSVSSLQTLSETFTETVNVTAWTAEGHFAGAFFSIYHHRAENSTSTTATGSLSNSDSESRARPGAFADFYEFRGSGSITVTMTGFDSVLYLYDANGQLLAQNDDGGPDRGSRISWHLHSGQTYYLEATSYNSGQSGNYTLSASSGSLVMAANPWSDGGTSEPVLVVNNGFRPHLSRDASRIAFTRLTDSTLNARSEVWIVNLDGTGLRRLTTPSGASDLSPQWTPDGRSVAFVRKSGSYRSASSGALWAVDLDGSNLREAWPTADVNDFCFHLLSGAPFVVVERNGGIWMSTQAWPSLSGWVQRRDRGGDPRGQSEPGGNSPNIVIYDPTLLGARGAILFNPSNLQESIFDNGGAFPWPCLSPNGVKVVAGSDGGLPIGIYVMDDQGHNPTAITTGPPGGSDHQPSWSRDTIVFVRRPSGGLIEHGNIYRITQSEN